MIKLARAFPALTLASLAALAACQDAPTDKPMSTAPASAKLAQTPGVEVFKVKFDELNNSGVKAEATLEVRDGDLTVTLDAVGRALDGRQPRKIVVVPKRIVNVVV